MSDNISLIISGVSALASVVGAVISWNKERKLSQGLRKNKQEELIKEIIKETDDIFELASEYWLKAGIGSENKMLLADRITYKLKNISDNLTLLNRKYQKYLKKDITEYSEKYNDFKTETTGGCFQSNPSIDPARAKKISTLASEFKALIRNELHEQSND